jgi:hypothetical protein
MHAAQDAELKIQPFRIAAFQVPDMTDTQIQQVPGDAFAQSRDHLQLLHRRVHKNILDELVLN